MYRSKPVYFERIREDAVTEWETMERSSWRNAVYHLFRQVQSPQHVISELLQNADDAGAHWARITVIDDVFTLEHDGEDFAPDQLRALCSFAISSKTTLFTIGFRGIGFKSCFSYGPRVEILTLTLAIAFDANRFTVPQWIDDAPVVDHTVIRIRLRDAAISVRSQEDIAFWVANPTPLLFFRHLEFLELQGTKVRKEFHGKGPIPGSQWVRLIGRESQNLLHIISEAEEFPPDALEEIRSERNIGNADFPPCRIDLVLGDHSGERLYVVLPTEVKLDLSYSCNAPFLQDPGRRGIKDPIGSPTNRWLLERAGRLAARAFLSWLTNPSLPVEHRAEAYRLVSPPLPDESPAHVAIVRTVLNAFWSTLEGQPILLTADGDLAHPGACVAIPPQLFDVWARDDLQQMFASGTRHLLSPAVPARSRDVLKRWGKLEVYSAQDVVQVLNRCSTLPRPDDERLLALWSFLQPLLSDWQFRRYARSLPIVPVLRDQHLYPAAAVVVLGQRDQQLSDADWSFILHYIHVADRGWIERLLRTDVTKSHLDQEDPHLRAAADLFRLLGLNQPVGLTQLIGKVAEALFKREDPADDGIRLALIAARANATLDRSFRFRCRDGRWRPVSSGLLVEPDGQVEELLPRSWAAAHVLNPAYEDNMTPAERSAWRTWATSPAAGLWSFPPALEREEMAFGRERLERFCRERGGRVPTEFRGKTMMFVYRDVDFDDALWDHWHALAARDLMLWVKVARGLAGIVNRLSCEARVFHQPASIPHHLDHGPLTAGWIHKLRSLPCLPDTYNRPALPAELLRVTTHTAFLQDVERFVHPDFDQPSMTAFLDLLGVRSDPTSSDTPLQRLRALAQSENPPLHAVLALYRTVDRLAARLPGDKLAALRSAFQQERLIYAADNTWQTVHSVVQRNDIGIPGVLVIHPEAMAMGLNLWDRLGVPEQPSLEFVLDWLARLPPRQPVEEKVRARIVEVLTRQPRDVWLRCRAWLDMADQWAPAADLRWWVTSRDTVHGLFRHVREATANLTMLPRDFDPAALFDTLRPLESALEIRITEFTPANSPSRPPWLEALGHGLARVKPPVAKTSDSPAPPEHPDRAQALRLLHSVLQPVHSLKVEPYIGNEPAGQQRSPKALWIDQTIYVVGRSSVHHEELVNALASEFTDRAVRSAIAACIGRDSDWITDYLENHLDLMPSGTEGETTVASEKPALSGHPTPAGDGVTYIAVSNDSDGMTQADLDEIRHNDREEDELPGPLRRAPRRNRRDILIAYLRAHGYERVSDRLLRHPDGTTISLQSDLFHGVALDPAGNRIGAYWVGDRALPFGLMIPADVWTGLSEHPNTSWIILPEGPDAVRAYRIDELRELVDLHPATFRITLKPRTGRP